MQPLIMEESLTIARSMFHDSIVSFSLKQNFFQRNVNVITALINWNRKVFLAFCLRSYFHLS